MKKLFIITVLSSFFLVACGGEGGDSVAITIPVDTSGPNQNGYTVEEVEAVLNLPPEPTEDDPDYHTVLGVDSNENYIRDDIERKIAITHYPKSRLINALNAVAIRNFVRNKSYQDKDRTLFDNTPDQSGYGMMCYDVC